MKSASAQTINLVGYGSQGAAWAYCLNEAGWTVRIFLGRQGKSFEQARKDGFSPEVLTPSSFTKFSDSILRVALLCPDSTIGPVYRDFFASLNRPMTLILAHGYSVYSNDLKPVEESHHLALFAPKAIGPKIRSAFQNQTPHALVCAFQPTDRDKFFLDSIGMAMGFAKENRVEATFEQEAIGDLISEQGLLCGGVFSLLEWTMKAMFEAKIPPKLIREECFSELELIAGLVKELGPAATLDKISEAAKCGTVAIYDILKEKKIPEAIAAQAKNIESQEFVNYLNKGEWRSRFEVLKNEFSKMEKNL